MKKHLALAALLASVAMPAAAQTVVQTGPAVGATVTTGPVLGAPAPAVGATVTTGPAFGSPMMVQGAPVRMDRETFRMMAMMSDSFEIASSRLALERSRNPRVLAYARNMIADHSMTSQALNGGTPVYAADGNIVTGSAAGAAAGAGIGFLAGGPIGAAVGAGVGATTGSVAGATGAPVAIRTAVPLDARKSEMLNQLAAAEGRQFDRLYGQMQLASHQEALGLFTTYAQSGDDPQMVAFAQSVIPHLRDHVAGARRLPR